MGYKVKITAGGKSLWVSAVDHDALFYQNEESNALIFYEDRVSLLHDLHKGLDTPFIVGYDYILADDNQYEDLSPGPAILGLEKIEFI